MRYRSHCRVRTVQCCDTKGDPPAIPGQLHQGLASRPSPVGHTCMVCPGWGAVPWLRCCSMAGMLFHGWDAVPWLGCCSMAGMLFHDRDAILYQGCSAQAGMLFHIWDTIPRLGCSALTGLLFMSWVRTVGDQHTLVGAGAHWWGSVLPRHHLNFCIFYLFPFTAFLQF